AAGAADAGDDAEIVLVDVERDERLVERGEDAEVAAPGAPDRAQAGTVMGDRFRFLCRGCCGDHYATASLMMFSISAAVKGRPVYLCTSIILSRSPPNSARSSRANCPA